jgi:4-amino-4-deoxy-L-arabinose transferase-like glycosyltransferase
MAHLLRWSVAVSGAVARARAPAASAAAQLAWLLLIHVVLWTWVGVSSRSNFDTPGDMVEAYAWAQGWQWGYYKHPPLSAWVAGLWFSVVPESHVGYSMLSALNGAIGLAGLAFLAREFLPRHWVLLVVAAASLTPGVSSLAMRFNANAILISTWPWAIALFVRLMQRGRPQDAVLCGLACALAMLGKYYSAVLLLTLVCAALWLPVWRQRLLSPAVGLAVATFLICLAPHALWLVAQTEGPLQYAQAAAGHQSAGESVMRAFTFMLAQCVFPVIAWLTFAVALTGPHRLRTLWSASTSVLRPSGDVVWLLAVLPIVATMLGTVLTGARTASVWGLPISAGLALLAARRAHEAGAVLSLPRLWRTMAAIWLAVAVLSPVWWWSRAQLQTPAVSEPREELAQALAHTWRAEHGGRLPWVSGTRALAASTAFYAEGHPRYWSLWNSAIETPWADTSAVIKQGAIIVCDQADGPCQSLAETWSADRRSLHITKRAHGFHFPGRDYVVYLVPPSSPMPTAPMGGLAPGQAVKAHH